MRLDKLSTSPETSVSDPDIIEHIGIASRLVDDLLGNKSLSDVRLKDIERYLSAHFAALFNKEIMAAERQIGGATTEYYLTNAVGKYLELTVWGSDCEIVRHQWYFG